MYQNTLDVGSRPASAALKAFPRRRLHCDVDWKYVPKKEAFHWISTRYKEKPGYIAPPSKDDIHTLKYDIVTFWHIVLIYATWNLQQMPNKCTRNKPQRRYGQAFALWPWQLLFSSSAAFWIRLLWWLWLCLLVRIPPGRWWSQGSTSGLWRNFSTPNSQMNEPGSRVKPSQVGCMWPRCWLQASQMPRADWHPANLNLGCCFHHCTLLPSFETYVQQQFVSTSN